MAQPIKEEYGVMTFIIEDKTPQKNDDKTKTKMKTLILTTDPNDRLYSFKEQEEKMPKYYLPFYINIFNNYTTVEKIKEIQLKDLFIKEFNDFITITLKQELSLKTCINFIKDKSLVTRFISEYKVKRPREYERDTKDQVDDKRYETFVNNVFIYLIKIILTPAGSFIYQKKNPAAAAAAAVAPAAAAAAAVAPAAPAAAAPAPPTDTFSFTRGDRIKQNIKEFLTTSKKYFSISDVNNLIKLSIKETNELTNLPKTILDRNFQKEKDKLLQEKSYGFVSELDYKQILKDNVLIKLKESILQNESDYKPNTKLNKFEEDLVIEVKKAIDNLNIIKKESTIIKNEIDIKKDIINLLKLFYIEKKKNELQREKKINIHIDLINDIIFDVDIIKKQFEGAATATFNDIILFQKKIKEEISQYVKNCQNPRDIQDNLKKECNNICNKPKSDLKNKLWCNICENYIQCVYDKKYITINSNATKAEEILKAANDKLKATENKVIALRNANKPVADSKEAEAAEKLHEEVKKLHEEVKKAQEEKDEANEKVNALNHNAAASEQNKKKLFYIDFEKASTLTTTPSGVVAGVVPGLRVVGVSVVGGALLSKPKAGSIFQYKKKTVSKKQLLKPKRKESFKILNII